MRIEVGTVRTTSRIAVVAAVMACALGTFRERFGSGSASPLSVYAIHSIAAYGLTFLSFAAFPFCRRTDLVKLVILGAALAEVAKPLIGRDCSLALLLFDAAGAFAVLAPSFMERFRSLTRADPHEPFSMVYPNDRRQRSMRTRRESGVAKPVRV